MVPWGGCWRPWEQYGQRGRSKGILCIKICRVLQICEYLTTKKLKWSMPIWQGVRSGVKLSCHSVSNALTLWQLNFAFCNGVTFISEVLDFFTCFPECWRLDRWGAICNDQPQPAVSSWSWSQRHLQLLAFSLVQWRGKRLRREESIRMGRREQGQDFLSDRILTFCRHLHRGNIADKPTNRCFLEFSNSNLWSVE